MLHFERQAQKEGFSFIIGVDEAGRGPLAGPVVAGAVLLKSHKFRNKITDSKKMTLLQRERAFQEIFENAYVGIGIVNETIIDSVNILRATHHAMAMAVRHLIFKFPKTKTGQRKFQKNVCILVDGNSFKTDLPYAFKTIIRGDNLSLSISCASVIAKVTRDRILDAYDQIFPQYGFKKHKGYPTLAHRLAIQNFGFSPIHRRSFHIQNVFSKG